MILLWISAARREAIQLHDVLAAMAIGAYLVQLLFVGLHETLPLLFLAGGIVLSEQTRAAEPSTSPVLATGRGAMT